MMSKERELLKKALDFMLDAGANLNPLFKEINDNLLAQPEQTEQKPLSDEAIADLWWNNYVGTADSVRNFARGIEKAHGIGENDE
jgi:hypothetical protein